VAFQRPAGGQEELVTQRIETAMRFLRRKRVRRLESVATLLIELDQLAIDRRSGRTRTLLRF
jgi:hypothetical protein